MAMMSMRSSAPFVIFEATIDLKISIERHKLGTTFCLSGLVANGKFRPNLPNLRFAPIGSRFVGARISLARNQRANVSYPSLVTFAFFALLETHQIKGLRPVLIAAMSIRCLHITNGEYGQFAF